MKVLQSCQAGIWNLIFIPCNYFPCYFPSFVWKCTIFTSNCTNRAATAPRKEPVDVRVPLWDLDERALITRESVMVTAEVRVLALELGGYLQHSCTDARLRCSDGPFWARLSKQTDRVSGETEVPQRQPGKSEPDLPGERGREQTGFISLFLIPLTRLTGSTAAVSAGSMSARMGTEEILKIYVCQTFLFCL